ncbi:D-alanyl-D-alanine carboxypeptidase [Durusdinium trenchii]
MASRYNMSFTFGFVNSSGRLGMASGVNSIWSKRPLKPDDLIPLGSVTKSWTAVMVMQAVDEGIVKLEDSASKWIDPVLSRLWHSSMEALWGKAALRIRVHDLLGMTSCIADYDDFYMEHFTFVFAGDDAGPFLYLKSAARQGLICTPDSSNPLAVYSGANYILLGLLLVQARGFFSWQDLDQIRVIPKGLFRSGRYSHTSFSRLGRCIQYPGIAHQYAWKSWLSQNNSETFSDLLYTSCLNGWTMGNIASSALDLATFFFDLFSLPKERGGFLTRQSLLRMQQMKTLNDTWCEGPTGPGSCSYGMGLLQDQLGQDFWVLQDPTEDLSKIKVIGHPGEDWGSGCSPCGFNRRYGFGICMAYTSVIGMNCSGDFRENFLAVQTATCLAYDAVLKVLGAPRLNCTNAALPDPPQLVQCAWDRTNTTVPSLPAWQRRSPHMVVPRVETSEIVV